jgi:DNA polymerase-1
MVVVHPVRQVSLQTVYAEVDKPVLPVLIEMESTGVLIDVDLLKALGEKIAARLEEVRAVLYFANGGEFNLNSPVQVAAFLYDRLGLPPHRKLGRSTAKEAIEPLRKLHYAVEVLAEYRRLEKLRGTYVEKIPTVLGPDGRLRAHFNNVVVETGRLSSSDPVNLQNIPKRILPGTPPAVEEVIKGIRRSFVARPGWQIVKFDQAAVEFRVLACLAGEQSVIDAILAGKDPHIATAADYLDVRYEDYADECAKRGLVPKKVREMAKTVNYGCAYGQTELGLSEWGHANGMPMTPEEAKRIQGKILGNKPKILEFIRRQRELIRLRGYAETYFGRRIWYPDVRDERRWVVEAALREGVNAVIQGTAADIMKIAMARIWKEIRKRQLKSKAILAVHDEFVLEVPDDEVETVMQIINEIATRVVDWAIPLEIEMGSGRNWAEAA